MSYRAEDIVTYLCTICHFLAAQRLFPQPNAAFGNLFITDNVRGKLGGRGNFPVKKQKGQILSFLSCGTSREWASDLNLAKSMFYLLPSILNC